MLIRDKSIFSSERVLHKDDDCKGSVTKKKTLGVSLKGLDAKTKLIVGKPPVIQLLWVETGLSQLRFAAVRSEKLVAEAGDSPGTQRKGNVQRWSRYQATASEDRRLYMCCSDLWSV
jgi:hypothetical protein